MTTNWLFPNLLPEELLISACARFADRLAYRNLLGLNEDVFGQRIIAISSDLPAYLEDFVARLPGSGRPTADIVIDEHTQLPYYSPFILPNQLAAARQAMRGTQAGIVHAHVGMFASDVFIPPTLRLCAKCVAADRDAFEEAYWHRSHQLPGMVVCPQHAIPLWETNVATRMGKGRTFCRSAESAWRATTSAEREGKTLQAPRTWHPHLLAIARNVAWLLEQRDLCPGPESFQPRYQALLSKCGLASHRGDVDWPAFRRALHGYYPEELLTYIGCPMPNESDHHWVAKIVRKARHSAGPPLRHLLLMHFLDCPAQEFFTLPTDRHFFVPGPWPCLNPVGGHYRELRVTRCAVDFTDGSTPRGTFMCDDCGYAYYRHGPDRDENARYEMFRVRAYGPVWEEKLRAMWQNPTIQLQEIALVLGVENQTVKRRAQHLGLAAARYRIGLGHPVAPLPERGRAPYDEIHELLPRYKAVWLEARAKHPDWTVVQLREIAENAYIYTHRHDLAWLKANTPAPKRRPTPPTLPIDWVARDIELAQLVDSIAQSLVSKHGAAKRLSRNAICSPTKRASMIVINLWRLPLTRATLARYTGTEHTRPGEPPGEAPA